MSDTYDVQQICENGHQITGCYRSREKERQDFCQKCGAPTIIACPNCNSKILGDQLEEEWADGGWYSVESSAVPSYCRYCGKAYLWTENKISAALDMFTEFGNLDEKEKETIEQDINNITKDIPQTELSAMRIKNILKKSSKVIYGVVMDLASKAAAEIIKNPY